MYEFFDHYQEEITRQFQAQVCDLRQVEEDLSRLYHLIRGSQGTDGNEAAAVLSPERLSSFDPASDETMGKRSQHWFVNLKAVAVSGKCPATHTVSQTMRQLLTDEEEAEWKECGKDAAKQEAFRVRWAKRKLEERMKVGKNIQKTTGR